MWGATGGTKERSELEEVGLEVGLGRARVGTHRCRLGDLGAEHQN